MPKKASKEQKRAAKPAPKKKQIKPLYVSFMAEVNQTTSEALIGSIGGQLQNGFDELHLFLSTPGGNVREGIAVYNMLTALPLKVFTYNISMVDSIGNVIFLAGTKRYANRTSRFMFHGVGFDTANQRFEEKQLIERLGGLQSDQKLISEIIVRRTKITPREAHNLFLQADFLGAKEAKARGIIDEIRDANVPKGATFIQLVFQR